MPGQRLEDIKMDRCPDYRNLEVTELLMLWRGTAVAAAYQPALLAVVICVLCCLWIQYYPDYYPAIDGLGHQLLIVPVGFLMVVRTNLAYDRWWNGRLTIGKVLFHSRQIETMTMNYINADDPDGEVLRRTMMQYVYVMFVVVRHNLLKRSVGMRGDPHDYKEYLTVTEFIYLKNMSANRPIQVISWLRHTLRNAKNHILLPQLYQTLDMEISGLLQAWQQAAILCSTPMPMPYAHLLKWLQFMWVYTVPIPLVGKLNNPLIGPWFAPFIVLLMAITLLGLDAIGSEIEDPFGNDYNDIPVEDVAKNLVQDTQYISYGMDLPGEVKRIRPTFESPRELEAVKEVKEGTFEAHFDVDAFANASTAQQNKQTLETES